jgi:uncharacterized RDD family membrane protein YckC
MAAPPATAGDMSDPGVPYAGIATRAIGLAVDVLIVQVIVFAGGAVLALVASLVGGFELDTVARILAAVAWATTVFAYFVTFWATVGQTPGMRTMDLRVMTAQGEPPGVGRSIVRVIGLGLAIIPLFAGFLPILVDDRRRGLHDMLAGTVVLHATAEPPPAPEPARSSWTPPPVTASSPER